MSENKKPRLAEVLGVEVNETFDFVGGGFTHCCYVDSNGWLRDQNDNMCDTHAVFLINNPQYMRRRPRWTEQEVEDAKNIIRMFGEDHFTHVAKDENGWPMLSDGYEDCATFTVGLEKNIFPSLKPEQTVKLAGIIGGDE